MSIQVSQVSKRFGAFQALREVDLQVGQGELVALLGPSGCGKTTLLRIIAGLEVADEGRILFDGEDVTGTDVRQREVGFVFQHYALFRHMTVFDNIAFGLTVRPRGQRLSVPQIKARVTELLERVQLESLANRHPSQLSGGQRQRVALARALAVQPRVLLLDEPFGALDAQVRKELRRWVRRLHEELHVTSVFVTHDQEEALEVADRVVLMHQGQVEQVGTPQEVWDDPASAFVCGFLGDVNRLSGRAHEGQLHLDGVVLGAAEHALARDAAASAYVRPHDLDVQPWRPGEPGIVASLQRAIVLGPIARLELMPINKPGPAGSDSTIEARIPAERFRELGLREGATLSVLPRKARVFLEPAGQPA